MTTQLELTRDISKAEINKSMNIGPPPKCMNRVLNPRSWFERPSFIILALLGFLLYLWLLWGAAKSVIKRTCMHMTENTLQKSELRLRAALSASAHTVSQRQQGQQADHNI